MPSAVLWAAHRIKLRPGHDVLPVGLPTRAPGAGQRRGPAAAVSLTPVHCSGHGTARVGSIRSVSNPVQIIAVGAAAPAWRLPASEVAAGLGPQGRPGPGRGLPARRGRPHPRRRRRPAARSPPRASRPTSSTACGGAPPARRSRRARATRSSPRPSACRPSPAARCAPAPPTPGIEALLGAADAVAAGSARVALVVASDALIPGAGHGVRGAVAAPAAAAYRARRRRRRRGARSAPASRGRTRTSTATAATASRPRATSTTAASSAKRCSSRRCATSASSSSTLDIDTAGRLPDPDGRLGATVAKQLDAGTPASAAVYAQLGDTGAAAALLGGDRRARRRGTGRHRSASAAAAPPASSSPPTGPCPVRPSVAAILADGRPATYAEVLRGPQRQLVPTGETVPMGVPPESAQLVRGADEILGLLGARCVDCGTINTPPSIHPHCISCGSSKFVLEPDRPSRRRAHVRDQPHDAARRSRRRSPLAVIDLDDGARVMLQVVGDGYDLDDRLRGRPRAPPLRRTSAACPSTATRRACAPMPHRRRDQETSA